MQHTCDNRLWWYPTASDLNFRLQQQEKAYGNKRGWALKYRGNEGGDAFTALQTLHKALATALRRKSGADGAQRDANGNVKPEDVEVLATRVLGGLSQDHADEQTTPHHDAYATDGWLLDPSDAIHNGAVGRAEGLLARIGDALNL